MAVGVLLVIGTILIATIGKKTDQPKLEPAVSEQTVPAPQASPPPAREATPPPAPPSAPPGQSLPQAIPVARPLEPPTTTPPGRLFGAPSEGLSAEDLFAKTSPAVVRVEVRDTNLQGIASGSGFFVSLDGLLVTNLHVVKDGTFISVVLSDDTTLFVDGVLAKDEEADLALLKVNTARAPYLGLSTALPKIGAKVYAIGNPRGLTNTLSEGLISGHRSLPRFTLIQTTASISPGSSGGPLLTSDGTVVGVTTLGSPGGGNLNFCIPATEIERLIENRGAVRDMASAGSTPLDAQSSKQLENAWAAMGRQDWASALTILTRLQERHPDNPFVWFAMARLNSELGDYPRAITLLKRYLAARPNVAAAHNNIGVVYARMRAIPEAMAAYTEAIRLSPTQPIPYMNRSLAYYQQGSYRLAWEDLVKCRDLGGTIDPKYVAVLRRAMDE